MDLSGLHRSKRKPHRVGAMRRARLKPPSKMTPAEIETLRAYRTPKDVIVTTPEAFALELPAQDCLLLIRQGGKLAQPENAGAEVGDLSPRIRARPQTFALSWCGSFENRHDRS